MFLFCYLFWEMCAKIKDKTYKLNAIKSEIETRISSYPWNQNVKHSNRIRWKQCNHQKDGAKQRDKSRKAKWKRWSIAYISSRRMKHRKRALLYIVTTTTTTISYMFEIMQLSEKKQRSQNRMRISMQHWNGNQNFLLCAMRALAYLKQPKITISSLIRTQQTLDCYLLCILFVLLLRAGFVRKFKLFITFVHFSFLFSFCRSIERISSTYTMYIHVSYATSLSTIATPKATTKHE